MVINAAGPEMGTALAVCVKDTIKEVDAEGIVVSTPARETLRAVQTPQVFRLPVFWGKWNRQWRKNDIIPTIASFGSTPDCRCACVKAVMKISS